MVIALSSELLTKIGDERIRFKGECAELKEELLNLGKVICEKIEETEDFRNLLMDTDF